ncbi:MAG: dihydrofolate reductase [Anaerolineales bacterium]|nr:dihydrofolate reductase [Anaerolineales bacterium]
MRKLIVAEFVSLDGVMENPVWSLPYWDDEIAAFKGEETSSSDALLLGRKTYEGFAAAWPGRTNEDDEGAEYMNSVRKYVVTSTLDNLSWNNSHVIKGDIATEIARLKAKDGGNLLVNGSAMLVNYLLDHDLVDVYRLLVYPVVLGVGLRLFTEGNQAKLELIENKSFESGAVALIYQPARA